MSTILFRLDIITRPRLPSLEVGYDQSSNMRLQETSIAHLVDLQHQFSFFIEFTLIRLDLLIAVTQNLNSDTLHLKQPFC